METPALIVEDLAVLRGGRRIVDGASLSVAPGEIYALLGVSAWGVA